MNIEVRHLQALVAVVDEGGFTAAAAVLGTGQPAVSRAISQLEAIVGLRLLDRTTREVKPTEAGRRAHQAAVVALRAVAGVSEAVAPPGRPLRLGYSWAAFGRHTSAILRGWRERQPAVELQVLRADTRDAGLRRGRVDVAIIRGEFADLACATVVVDREERMAALPANHPLAARENLELADLVDQTLIVTPASGTTTVTLWPASTRPTRLRRSGNIDEWLTLIAAGEAVGVTAGATAFTHPHPDIVFRPLLDAPDVPVLLAWAAVAPHPAVADFISLVQDIVGASVPLRRLSPDRAR